MGQIIFAQPRTQYDSYTDYRHLVELSNFPTVFVDEIDLQSDNLYIVSPMNGEFDAHIDWKVTRNCAIYHWNLERPGNGTLTDFKGHNNRRVREGKVDKVLLSDKLLARLTQSTYMPLGSHERLGTPCEEKVYDYIHLMCYSPRRGLFYQYPHSVTDIAGMKIAPNSWGAERHAALQHSKMLVNVHQDNHIYMEPLRFALAAAYALPIVSEHIPAENDTYVTHKLDMYSPARSMRTYLSMYDANIKNMRLSGWDNHARMTGEFSFRRCIERYI